MTALRWARILRSLGQKVRVRERWSGEPARMLIAIHAEKSAPSVARFAAERPGLPVVLAVAGTDLYPAASLTGTARRALRDATRIVVLQPDALDRLDPDLRCKTRVIRQSARAPERVEKPADCVSVVVAAHLRRIKDPLLAARAARDLSPSSRVRVTLLGEPLDPDLADEARAEASQNPRFRWAGPLPHALATRAIARSHLCVNSSLAEGGSIAISEALAAGTPVLASAIPGNVGVLGEDWPGLFSPSDRVALRDLLRRFEEDPIFRATLERGARALRPLFLPERETEAWRELLAEILA
ncbi:MAG: GPMC system family 4 glycosyltransferase [Planctomycetota bacterium]